MKSIRLKLWLAVFGVSMVVVAFIWIFMIYFLESSYVRQKKDEIRVHTQQIAETINENGITAATAVMSKMSKDYNYSVELFTVDNGVTSQIQVSAPNGGQNILDGNQGLHNQIFKSLFNNSQQYHLFDNASGQVQNKFFIGATYQETTTGGYILLVASTLAPVHEAVSTIRQQLMIIFIVIIVLSTLAALLISRSFTKPILRLTAAAKEIAGGNLETYVPIQSKDEIGELEQNFNMMSKEISRASTLQRELVANVSHDIRTPLTMIKGYAETIKDLTGDHPEKRNQQLDVIIEETNRLNALVNDMLNLSKLQAGQQSLEYDGFDLSELLRDTMKRYDLLIEQEGFQFEINAPEHVTVYADELKIGQVLYNLINNATNHTGRDKKVIITITETANNALVQITDTGKGILPEHLPLIWDRYYKPYKKDDRKGMGTGLGLSIVKSILTQHNFRYGAESVVGSGSTFWFEVGKGNA